MKCKNCGMDIDEGKPFCPYCGTKIDNPYEFFDAPPPETSYDVFETPKKKVNTLCLAGMIVSIASIFIFSPAAIVGIILSAIGMKNFDPNTETGRGYGKAGIIIGIVVIVLTVVLALCTFIMAGAIWRHAVDYDYYGGIASSMQNLLRN